MKQLRCTASALVIRTLPNGTDTGQRVPRNQLVTGHGESYDGRWVYIVAPAGDGWSSAQYLAEVAPPTAASLAVIGRATWGAKHGTGSLTPGAKKLVVAHHFATPDVSADATKAQERQTMQNVERHHAVMNKWAGIGYSFVIFQSGRVYEGRGWNRAGAHTAGQNSKSVGVAFAIDGQQHALSEAAQASFRALMGEGVRRGLIAPDYVIRGHRDFASTRCPGDRVYSQLGSLR